MEENISNNSPLVVDGGFSAAKATFGDQQCRIKTAYRHDQMNGDLFNGRKLVTGNEALAVAGSMCLSDVEQLIHYYPLFIHACARKFGISTAPILAVGLPYDYWKTEAIKSSKGTSNMIAVLENKLKAFTVGNFDYTFDAVRIYPQGLGAIKAHLANNPNITGNCLSLDFGFNTVIYSLYSAEHKRIINGQTYYKKGIYDMAQNMLRPAIAHHVKDKSYTSAELNHLIETKEVQIGLRTISIKDEVMSCVEAYTIGIIEQIMRDIKESQGVIMFKHLAISGGGARLLTNIDFSHPGLTVSIAESPEMQNAIGFELLAREEFGLPLRKAA